MSDQWPKTPFKHLLSDRDYVVVRSFVDFDGGLSLFAIIGGARRLIRMQWREEEQGPIIDKLEDYVVAAR